MGHLRLASLFAVWVFLARSASAMPSAVMLPAADAAANITPAHSVVASTGPTAHFDIHLLPKGTLTSQMVEQEGTLAAWVAAHL
ncbi:MAG TPA: hypothetical protein VGZ23_12385 [bacterium]|nr:hypothetical protein [bacterium]